MKTFLLVIVTLAALLLAAWANYAFHKMVVKAAIEESRQ